MPPWPYVQPLTEVRFDARPHGTYRWYNTNDVFLVQYRYSFVGGIPKSSVFYALHLLQEAEEAANVQANDHKSALGRAKADLAKIQLEKVGASCRCTLRFA